MPTGVEIEARRKAAVEMIGRTGRNEFSSPVKLELYDVQDLTYAMADFPGVDISLAQDLVVNDAAKMTAGPGLIGEVTKLNQELNRAQKSLAEELAKTEEERILDTENSSRRLATSSEVRGFVKKLERPVTKADELEFPDMATWKELIAK